MSGGLAPAFCRGEEIKQSIWAYNRVDGARKNVVGFEVLLSLELFESQLTVVFGLYQYQLLAIGV